MFRIQKIGNNVFEWLQFTVKKTELYKFKVKYEVRG